MNAKTKKNQKVRRWSYKAILTKDGQTSELPLQTLSIGTAPASKQSAKKLEEQLRADKQLEGYDIRVVNEGHETISPTIMAQIQGMEFELTTYRRSVKKLAEQIYDKEHPLAEGHVFDEVGEQTRMMEVAKIAGRAVVESRVELQRETLPKLEQLATEEEVAAVEAASEALPETVEEEQPRRKLGIEAVNEILNTPVEQENQPEATLQ